jgi:integrase
MTRKSTAAAATSEPPRYSVVRYDPYHEPRVPNTERPRERNRVLPVDFPMVFDLHEEAVVEPVLLHLHDKFFKSGSVRKGVWTKRQSADNAAEDLRVWWQYLHDVGKKWDSVTDNGLATYLTILAEEPSESTEDFLAPSTIGGRKSSLKAFYEFAGRTLGLARPPSVDNAITISRSHPGARRQLGDDDETESNPRPMDRETVDRIAEKLGPLPSAWKGPGTGSSKSRLALELGVNVGLRIDEIENLRAAMFERMTPDPTAWDVPKRLAITKTKGLVKRTVEIPQWLVEEIKTYLDEERGERAASLRQARRTWMRPHHRAPANLLLTEPRGASAGKKARRKQIEADWANAIAKLDITEPRTLAEGTDDEQEVMVARHVFHDCRHTYAYWTYRNFLELEVEKDVHVVGGIFDAAVRHVQRLLGHRTPEVTKAVYLDVFEEVSVEITALLQKKLRGIRKDRAEEVA